MSESQNIEYKSIWEDKFLKWICGFANAQGGKIYIGIDDKGKIVGVESSHEGRYIELDNSETIEDSDYIRHKNGADNFKVALTHASLNTKPLREVHGGCTPEEILVPFLVISNKKSAKAVEKSVETKQPTEIVVSDTQKKEGFEEEELF
jgi:uncharacterized protein YuzE